MRVVMAMAALVLPAACMFDGDFKHDGPTRPEPLADGWEVAAPETVGLSVEALERVHAELLREDAYLATTGLLIAKDGKLVFESYLRDSDDRDRVHHFQSATKSVTSLLVAMARDRGAIRGLDCTVGELFPDRVAGLDARKSHITLEALLTMRSGLDFGNDTFSLEMLTEEHDDPLRTILEKPLYAAPGEEYRYRDADPQIVSYMLTRTLGISAEQFAREALFAPLGITHEHWEALSDGTTVGGAALHLRPRDFLKLGQLVLDRGRWQGRQLVSEALLEESTAPAVDSTTLDRAGVPYRYGFYWWILPEGVAAWGHGGQFLYVLPERRMVIMQIAMPDAELHGSMPNDFLELLDPLLAP